MGEQDRAPKIIISLVDKKILCTRIYNKEVIKNFVRKAFLGLIFDFNIKYIVCQVEIAYKKQKNIWTFMCKYAKMAIMIRYAQEKIAEYENLQLKNS